MVALGVQIHFSFSVATLKCYRGETIQPDFLNIPITKSATTCDVGEICTLVVSDTKLFTATTRQITMACQQVKSTCNEICNAHRINGELSSCKVSFLFVNKKTEKDEPLEMT